MSIFDQPLAVDQHGDGNQTRQPSVSVLIPTYQEEASIDACLEAVAMQTYSRIVEVLVIDGRSSDATRELAGRHRGVTVLDNPDRIQSSALNVGIEAARGEVLVRVDGHAVLAEDYVERCVEALSRTGAAIVGGGMTPMAEGRVHEGIAAAMGSRFGAGPARFHVGGASGWVDTVYLGAYHRKDAQAVGGYDEELRINEDAEFAHRMAKRGGIWFDPTIRSTYTPRASLPSLARQFFRYGRGRAKTTVLHPSSLKPRQLAAPLVVLGLASSKRRIVGAVYLAGLAAAVAKEGRPLGRSLPAYTAALPIMHLTWGVGFLLGLVDALAQDGSKPRTGDHDNDATAPLFAAPGSEARGVVVFRSAAREVTDRRGEATGTLEPRLAVGTLPGPSAALSND